MFYSENFEKRSQDWAPAFQDEAQFYWGRAFAWLPGQCVFSDASAPVLLPRHRVIDLDISEDWKEVEFFFNCIKRMPNEK